MRPSSILSLNPLRQLRHWWLARLPRQDTQTLTHHNVYILPSGAGLLLGATLLVLLLASINYQLSLGYLLTFLLLASALASMHVGHGNLRGLQLHLQLPVAAFCGQPARLLVDLINPQARPRHGIGLHLNEKPDGQRADDPRVWCDVPALGHSSVTLSTPTPQRGWQSLPRITVASTYPLGTFRVWTLWQPAARVLVYPRPEPNAPPLPLGQAPQHAPHGRPQPQRSSPEFDGVRPYRAGDSPRRILWKKSMHSPTLLSREQARAWASADLYLDLAQAGPGPLEHQLSRLCAWVLDAEQRGLRYGLQLPHRPAIAPGQGSAHQHRCLEALALC